MPSHATAVLQVLQETSDSRNRDLEEFDGILTDTDNENSQDSIFNKFIDYAGRAGFMTLTKLNLVDFNFLLGLVDRLVKKERIKKKGEKVTKSQKASSFLH